MGLDEWEFLDCHEDDDKKISSDKRSVDHRSIPVSDEQHPISDRAACNRQEAVDTAETGKDTVSQVSGQKLIDNMKNESSDVQEEVEGKEEGVTSRRMNMALEKREKWGKAAICSFGIAVAATICTVLLGSHRQQQQQGGSNKQHQKNQIWPCE